MQLSSFYGGPNGQSFTIKEIFTSKNTSTKVSTHSIVDDLAKGWTSPISVGEFVVVSYGIPNETETYKRFKQIDLDAEGKTFNFTLWQKTYTERRDILSVPETNFIYIDSENQYWAVTNSSNGLNYRLVGSLTGNTPELKLDPTTILDADRMPYVTLDVTDLDYPRLHFYLPQSQVMDQPSTIVIPPAEHPSVVLAGTVNKPKLIFSLPDAVKFYYGNLLGDRIGGPFTVTNSQFLHYNVGDYYINEETGFIYRIIRKTGNTTCIFEFQACIMAPLPEVKAVGVNPYTADGKQIVQPSVTSSFDDPVQKKGWRLTFNLPNTPKASATHKFVAPLEKGDVTVAPIDATTLNFDFKIPRGSKVFAGKDVYKNHIDTIIDGAEIGDLYINSETGEVYTLTSYWLWTFDSDGLRGPPGKALNIVKSYTFTHEEVNNTLEDIAKLIEEDYGIPESNELISVTWIDENGRDLSYWYFQTENLISNPAHWGRILVTGGIVTFIENNYIDDSDNPITDKTYSINYINSLIGGKLDMDKLDKTTFSKEQIIWLLSWGTFRDAIDGTIPMPDIGKDTFSAEEVIELMSWGSIHKLLMNALYYNYK